MKRFVAGVALAALAVLAPGAHAGDWRATWGAGMGTVGSENAAAAALQGYLRLTFPDLRAHDQTLREIVRVSIGGRAVRVRLSNALGDGELVIGGASVAEAASGGAVVAGTLRPLRFSGLPGATIPAGQELTSDAVDLPVRAGGQLAIGIHVARSPAAPTLHFLALTDSTMTPAGSGDHTNDTGAGAFVQVHRHWPWLSGIEVDAPHETGSIVAFGDSITDGAYLSNAFTDSKDQSWPSQLADRLATHPADLYVRGVVNAGISGNAVVARLNQVDGPSAIDRFDRDVLDRAGVTHVILFEGTNDIGEGGLGAGAVIAGLEQLVDRAHARAIKVIGATITPRSDGPPQGSWSAGKETIRQRVNAWIRRYPGYDGLIDFERAVADPAHPQQLDPAYDSGDHLHPNAAGRKAMVDAVELPLLQCVPAPTVAFGIRHVHRRLRLAGTAALGRCHSHAIDRVTLTVARRTGRGRCRFVSRHGKLLPARPCARPVLLTARGTTTWILRRPLAVPPGTYAIITAARAGDAVSRPEERGCIEILKKRTVRTVACDQRELRLLGFGQRPAPSPVKRRHGPTRPTPR